MRDHTNRQDTHNIHRAPHTPCRHFVTVRVDYFGAVTHTHSCKKAWSRLYPFIPNPGIRPDHDTARLCQLCVEASNETRPRKHETTGLRGR